ncbi:class I SAM-dependent methyltransferase [Methylobacterium fujisawaense]|uniref:class I SAM-dependent methyltransferase n=1 Tax=Methylobacterium fujisawaense TaxID=107400 RepID=UPI00244B4AC3|nr:class I SAM-dependent methyltransferase [Methylobacterium fujisawaense]MDH3030141.1 class I SAM-dependent methyltransferase [Methylobacterium fujisawaense]
MAVDPQDRCGDVAGCGFLISGIIHLSNSPVERPPDLWDQGCATDEIRNQFVIPAIIEVASANDPDSIIDIGCGSGYIAREVEAGGIAKGVAWRLLDYSTDMLSFARSRCTDIERTAFIRHDLRVEPRDIPKSILGYVAYTFLDFLLDETIALHVSDLIMEGGTLLVFLPDVLEDVIEAAGQDPAVLDEYRSGHCSLAKRDKFTSKNVLFEANRVENVIQLFLGAGLVLTHLRTHRSAKGKFHYMLSFRALSV